VSLITASWKGSLRRRGSADAGEVHCGGGFSFAGGLVGLFCEKKVEAK